MDPQQPQQQHQDTKVFKQDLSAKQDTDANSFPKNIERMFETFHQSPHGDFRPTFYNPFEVKHRRRTTKAQFKVLERIFQENCKPPAALRRHLAARLGMTPRAVQVWFQNRRAKLKTQQSKQQQVPGLSRSASGSDLSLQTTISPKVSEHASPNLTTTTCSENDGNGSDPQYEISVDEDGLNRETIMRPRSNSCPMITQLGVDLPFKPLQDALFGNYHHQRSDNAVAQQPSAQMYQSAYPTSIRSRSTSGPVYSYAPPSAYPALDPIIEESNAVPYPPVLHPSMQLFYPPASFQPPHQTTVAIPGGHADPADFDYLLQSAFGDQWLYYPPPQPQANLVQTSNPGGSPQPPDAFLMSFVEDASFES